MFYFKIILDKAIYFSLSEEKKNAISENPFSPKNYPLSSNSMPISQDKWVFFMRERSDKISYFGIVKIMRFRFSVEENFEVVEFVIPDFYRDSVGGSPNKNNYVSRKIFLFYYEYFENSINVDLFSYRLLLSDIN